MPRSLRSWPIAVPILGIAALFIEPSGVLTALVALVLLLVIGAAVHHAEIVAHRIGEPFGSLVLALAVTVIETGMIVSIMLDPASGGAPALARDTVFAAAMISLNLLLGLCLLLGGIRHHEQNFTNSGVNAGLATIAVLTVLTLVLPNYTASPGPAYSHFQLGFVAIVSLILYLTFVFIQTVRHPHHFIAEESGHSVSHAEPRSDRYVWLSFGLMLTSLVAVVLLAKALSPAIESAVISAGLPQAVIGVVIAAAVLMPESLAALRAARANQLQTSLNLGFGSALATIGLTIPAVAAVSLFAGLPVQLGLNPAGIALLVLTLFVSALSIQRGRTTLLQGALHLVIFAAYLLLTLVP